MVPKTGIRHKAQGVRQDAFPMRLVPCALRQQLITQYSITGEKAYCLSGSGRLRSAMASILSVLANGLSRGGKR